MTIGMPLFTIECGNVRIYEIDFSVCFVTQMGVNL